MLTQFSVRVASEWDIVNVRQLCRNFASEIGFSIIDQSRITTTVSELARNIYLYAKQGEIRMEALADVNKLGLKIVALDNGPGIADIKKAMQDGFTTSGGLGAGLPGVKRLMDEFDIELPPGGGTKVVVVKWLFDTQNDKYAR